MIESKEKLIQLIIKLIDLTKEDKIKWKFDVNKRMVFPNQTFGKAFVSEVGRAKFYLYSVYNQPPLNSTITYSLSGSKEKCEIMLEMCDDKDVVQLPSTIDLITLYELVESKNMEIENLIDEILES